MQLTLANAKLARCCNENQLSVQVAGLLYIKVSRLFILSWFKVDKFAATATMELFAVNCFPRRLKLFTLCLCVPCTLARGPNSP